MAMTYVAAVTSVIGLARQRVLIGVLLVGFVAYQGYRGREFGRMAPKDSN